MSTIRTRITNMHVNLRRICLIRETSTESLYNKRRARTDITEFARRVNSGVITGLSAVPIAAFIAAIGTASRLQLVYHVDRYCLVPTVSSQSACEQGEKQ